MGVREIKASFRRLRKPDNFLWNLLEVAAWWQDCGGLLRISHMLAMLVPRTSAMQRMAAAWFRSATWSLPAMTSRSQKSALGLFIAVSSADNLAKST
jgi:hypothetical protein